MASAEHPGSPGWTGPVTQCTAGTERDAPATGPDLCHPGPDEDSGGLEAWGLVGSTEVWSHLKYTCGCFSGCHKPAEQLS